MDARAERLAEEQVEAARFKSAFADARSAASTHVSDVYKRQEEGYAKMVENMRQLCHDVRCDFDKWFSERTVYILSLIHI